MKYKKFCNLKFILMLAVTALILPAAAAAQKEMNAEPAGGKTVYTGTIVTFSGRTLPFTMELDGRTTAGDAKKALRKLNLNGQEGFQKAVGKQDLGYFALDGSVGHRLRYVASDETDTGQQKIVAVFERWLKPFEIRYGTRSADYPFTYIELFVGRDGKGSGTIIGAARVRADKQNGNSLGFENFGAYPAKIIGLRMSRENIKD